MPDGVPRSSILPSKRIPTDLPYAGFSIESRVTQVPRYVKFSMVLELEVDNEDNELAELCEVTELTELMVLNVLPELKELPED